MAMLWIFVDRIYRNDFHHNTTDETNDIEKTTGISVLSQYREAALLTINKIKNDQKIDQNIEKHFKIQQQ